MAGLRSIHWLAPTVMTSSLVGALGLALGHHFFYHSLDGNTVAAGTYNIAGRHLSRQQFNTAVGNAFAFLIRLLLGIANSAAYVQLFFRSAIYAGQPTFDQLDWADSLVSNFFMMFDVRKWCRFPILVLAALVVWCTPIATIFPPATLVVESVQKNTSAPVQAPNLDFASFAYSGNLSPGLFDDSNVWSYGGTSQPIQNLAFAVVASGEGVIPNFNPTSPTRSANATWEFKDFHRPTLRCSNVTGTKRTDIWKNIWNSYNWTTTQAPVFMSWIPWSRHDGFNRDYGPVAGAGFNITGPGSFDRDLPYFITSTGMTGPSGSFVSTDGPISIFVAVMPLVWNITLNLPSTPGNGTVTISPTRLADNAPDDRPVILPQSCTWEAMEDFNETFTINCGDEIRAPAQLFDGASLLRCDLLNVSSIIGFDYSNRTTPLRFIPTDQTVETQVNGSRYFVGPPEDWFYSNASDLAAQNCTPFLADPFHLVQPDDDSDDPQRRLCYFDPQSLRLLSYQSLMSAFQQTFRGNITGALDLNSKIVDTVFMDTHELDWLRSEIGGNNSRFSLSSLYDRIPAAEQYRGTAAKAVAADQGSLGTAISDAFERLVLSLFAEPHFYPNYTSPFAPPALTNITTQGYQNVYIYDVLTLWIAYGLALLFTALAVAGGWIAIYFNGCSYSDNFSTFVRVGRTAELSVEVQSSDGSGCDPLPKYLERSRINIADIVRRRKEGVQPEGKAASEAQSLVAGSDDAGQWADDAQNAILRSSGSQQGEQIVGGEDDSIPRPQRHTIPRRPVASQT